MAIPGRREGFRENEGRFMQQFLNEEVGLRNYKHCQMI